MEAIRPQSGAQTKFLSTSADIAFGGGAAFGGKRGDITIPIATEHGWTTLGDIRVGDRVFAIDGTLATVIYISPIEIAEDA